MKSKFLIITSLMLILFTISSFAVMSVNGSFGYVTSNASPSYAIGLTIKSISTVGFELTIESTVNSLLNLSQIANSQNWNFLPTLIFSLPSGDLRPYVGLGVMTTYNFTTGFSAISLSTFYYRIGADLFLGNFSMFGEAQGTFYRPNLSFSQPDEWRFGAGLAF
uniref:Outer membrane protein beta-barrel domain-containing protein n=1 Tax=Mesoaciditoga lauensis TaxID=1495039 RepID=A0A7V3VTC4_9BACT